MIFSKPEKEKCYLFNWKDYLDYETAHGRIVKDATEPKDHNQRIIDIYHDGYCPIINGIAKGVYCCYEMARSLSNLVARKKDVEKLGYPMDYDFVPKIPFVTDSNGMRIIYDKKGNPMQR